MYNIRSKYSIFGSLREIQILSQKHSVRSNRLVRRFINIFFLKYIKINQQKIQKTVCFKGSIPQYSV